MLLKIILFVCFVPISAIIYFVLRNEAKPKKNLILGVTLPLYARTDDAVEAVVRRFLKRQMLAFLLLTLLAIPTFFIKYASVVLTWYLVWLIFVLTIPFALFMQSNAKLKALKQQNGWFSESTGLALVDVKLALTPKKTLSVWLFIPPVILSLIPVVHTALSQREGDAFWPLLTVYLSFAALTVVFLLSIPDSVSPEGRGRRR